MTLRAELLNNPTLTEQNGLFRQNDLVLPDPAFETLYRNLRNQEGRLYTDDVVRVLPTVPNDHPASAEWLVRKNTMNMLVNYLWLNKIEGKILELGCGNGWLSNKLSQMSGVEVCGMDINRDELEQATRVFSANRNVSFLYGNIQSIDLKQTKFDCIIFASSIQYFENLQTLFEKLKTYSRGEIHIIDSPFYGSDIRASAARIRTEHHFRELGVPELKYFHHTFEALPPHDILFNPSSAISRLKRILPGRTVSPFPWIRIKIHNP